VLPGWRRALDGQLDLARLKTGRGLVLYENLAWVPLRASVSAPDVTAVPVAPRDPTRAALGADLSAAEALPADAAAAPGVVLWGEAYDTAWEATGTNGQGTDRALRHFRAFGWENGYRVTSKSSVALSFADQWQRWAMLGASLVIWLFVLWRWWRTRIRSVRPRSESIRERREARARRDPLAEAVDDDTFWWERV
jgi:hypothetical protein